MKISIFFDQYCRFHEEKDPGQIPLGLLEAGIDTSVITLDKKELIDYQPSFPVVKKTVGEYYNEKFWAQDDSDVIVFYSWLIGSYTPLIRKIKDSRKKVFIKCDSDGRVEYPFKSTFLRTPLFEKFTVTEIKRNIWWSVPLKSLHEKTAKKIIEQIELSDGVIIETPEALSNLNFFLTYWKKNHLMAKIHFIPNPITPEFVNCPLELKENIVISSGRWNDFGVKNTQTMSVTLLSFLKENEEFKAKILGNGTERINHLIKEAPKNVRDRISILGPTDHRKVCEIMKNAKILFIPSRWESFSLASAEAVCMGCSIAGTPLESLRYLSMQGFSGTTASTFDRQAILAALLQDSIKWSRGLYDMDIISTFWRDKLNRRNVATSIYNVANASKAIH